MCKDDWKYHSNSIMQKYCDAFGKFLFLWINFEISTTTIFIFVCMFSAGPKLAAAVTNAGGLGVIGGYNMSPRILKLTIRHLKDELNDKSAPFGVDLLIPKVGGGARATNRDYTGGKLMELIDIIIESGAKLFVCAVGVAPREAVKKLHDAGILYMNMIGSPKHVKYALGAGADIICCQGGEGGGHTYVLYVTYFKSW